MSRAFLFAPRILSTCRASQLDRSEKDLRDLRQKITFALYAQQDDLDKVTSTVDHLFTLLMKAQSSQGFRHGDAGTTDL